MHDPNDPFGGADDERTIIRPNPGRRGTSHPRQAEPMLATGPLFDITELTGLNPLERAASLLLVLLGQIRNTSSHPNPAALHQQLAAEIRQFESRAQKSGLAPETIFTARYILCTTVDEFVLSTPWGANSIWRDQSLLRMFHQETSGGEKVFLLLDKLIYDPSKNIDLLELIYICLSLGFQGRYRVELDGSNKLEAIRENLYRSIRNHRGDAETALSLHWQGIDRSLESKTTRLPQWAILAIAAAVLGFIFIAFALNLNRHYEGVYIALLNTGKEPNLLPNRSPSPEPARHISTPTDGRFSLKEFLEPEIIAGQVAVDEQPDKTTVIMKGEGLFDSGGDVVSPKVLPILQRIGEGLDKTSGRIEVTGHSDNVPISTFRFPSNLSLSQARADEVVKILGKQVADPGRLSSLGMADRSPIATNNTAEGRAMNRRVEIVVYDRLRRN